MRSKRCFYSFFRWLAAQFIGEFVKFKKRAIVFIENSHSSLLAFSVASSRIEVLLILIHKIGRAAVGIGIINR